MIFRVVPPMPPGTWTYARQPLSNNATRIAAFSASRGALPLAPGDAWRCSECFLTSADGFSGTHNVARQPGQQRGKKHPILWSEPHPGRPELPLLHRDLVAQHQDLDVLLSSPIGNNRTAANAMLTARYAKRTNTSSHRAEPAAATHR